MAISQGLGRVLEVSDPVLAHLIDPFNPDARVRWIAQNIPETVSDEALAAVSQEIRHGLIYDPIDARLFSMMGELNQRNGNYAEALHDFQQAKALSKTEPMSVNATIGWSLQHGQVGDAAREIDTLLRRWPDRFGDVAPFLPPIMADKAGYDAVLKSINNGAPWRLELIRFLSGTPDGIALAEQLIGDSTHPQSNELATVISGRLRQGQQELAYRFFLFTLSPREQPYAGYVYNSSFAPVSLQRSFDWQYMDRAGIEWIRPREDDPEGGARLRLLNAPVQDVLLRQMIMLPPGKYKLVAEVSGTGVSLPKGLSWLVTCGANRSGQIGRLDIPEGSYQRRALTTSFTIPDSRCVGQMVQLFTDVVAPSWRFRYQGELTLHSVRIERADA
jgi:hypothetical protein